MTAERRRIAAFCPLCVSRCGCEAVVENGRLVAIEPDPSHPTGTALCAKGRASPELVETSDRLLQAAINAYLAEHNANPKPFVWTKSAEAIPTEARDNGRGIPQGSPISPLLANLYMRRFVLGWGKLGLGQRLGSRIVTYADDLVILCRRGKAEEALHWMRELMGKLKLTVNTAHSGDCDRPFQPKVITDSGDRDHVLTQPTESA